MGGISGPTRSHLTSANRTDLVRAPLTIKPQWPPSAARHNRLRPAVSSFWPAAAGSQGYTSTFVGSTPASGPKGEKFLNDSYASIDGVAGFSFPISVRDTGFDFKNPSWIVIACPRTLRAMDVWLSPPRLWSHLPRPIILANLGDGVL